MTLIQLCAHGIIRYWLLITLFIATAISLLSLWPLDNLPEVAGSDKLHHFIAYGGLAFPAAFARVRHHWLALFAMMVLGGSIELIQPYVNRYAEWLDFAANVMGLIIGTGMGLAARSLILVKK